MGLVKQICVSSNTVEYDFNKPYIRLLSVSMNNGFKAKIELDVKGKDGKITRKTAIVKNNSDLFQLSGEREFYEGYIVDNIDCTPGKECLKFTNQEVVPLGKAIGSIDENIIKRAQIRSTIETHLDKELRYIEKCIKVLSPAAIIAAGIFASLIFIKDLREIVSNKPLYILTFLIFNIAYPFSFRFGWKVRG